MTGLRAPKLTMASIVSTLSLTHQSLFDAKLAKGLSFEQIGEAMGRGEVWVASLFYAQAKPTAEDITKLAAVLDLDEKALDKVIGEAFYPERGLGAMPPTDALLYRLYEIVQVFGYPLKSVIHEKFGDGIMSAIDFRATVEKVHEEGADRVKLTFVGKWLPYKRW